MNVYTNFEMPFTFEPSFFQTRGTTWEGKGRYARLKRDTFLERLSNNKGTSFLDLHISRNGRDSTVLH